jgi:serine-type D-Ala-D-Ala carboxypeptidase (penicillin-binding protein 5/6)
VTARALAAAVVAALALGGCGLVDDGPVTAPVAATPQAPEAPVTPPQEANGALLTDGGPKAIDVQLDANPLDPVRVRFKRPPESGLLIDVDTGEVLWRLRPVTPLPIASLTKIMTAVLTAERTDADEKVRISARARDVEGSKIGILPKKKRVRLETLLNGLMLVSGNDAAVALAEHISGTEEAFVEEMNARARDERLACTRFASASGIVDEGNQSCAVDLAAMAKLALDAPRVARVMKRRRAVLPFPTKGGRIYLNGHNYLIKDGYPGALGVKTGYTDKAGRCFVGAAEQGGRRLAVVLLHSPDPGKQATQLLNRGFTAIAGG